MDNIDDLMIKCVELDREKEMLKEKHKEEVSQYKSCIQALEAKNLAQLKASELKIQRLLEHIIEIFANFKSQKARLSLQCEIITSMCENKTNELWKKLMLDLANSIHERRV